MGIDQLLGLGGYAMLQWQQANSMRSMQEQQYWAMQNVRNGPPMFTARYDGLAAQSPDKLPKHLRRHATNCEYCGSEDSIKDHGNGKKCANCGAS